MLGSSVFFFVYTYINTFFVSFSEWSFISIDHIFHVILSFCEEKGVPILEP